MAQHIINTSGEKSPVVYTSKKWKSFYQSFCTNRNNTDSLNMPIFDKYTNIYTLCCVIGFKEGLFVQPVTVGESVVADVGNPMAVGEEVAYPNLRTRLFSEIGQVICHGSVEVQPSVGDHHQPQHGGELFAYGKN